MNALAPDQDNPEPCTVLIVDDSREDREVYKAYLGRFPQLTFTFLEADQAAEGMHLIEEVRVDCVLLDNRLPDGTGVDFILEAYRHFSKEEVPIVMITGQGSEDVAVSAMKHGAVDYIAKRSIEPDELYRAVYRAHRLKRLAAQLAEQTRAREVAESALRDNEVTLQQLVESIEAYAIVTLSATGHVVNWNSGARKLFDYHDHEAIGRHLRAFSSLDQDQAGQPDREIEQARQRQGQRRERRFLRRDASVFLGSSTVYPVIGQDGVVRAFSWVVHTLEQAGP